MTLVLITMGAVSFHHSSVSAEANLPWQVKPQRGGHSQNLLEIWMAFGHIFSSGLTRASRALISIENVPGVEVFHA